MGRPLTSIALAAALLLIGVPIAGNAQDAVRDVGGRYAVEGETLNEAVREKRLISGIISIHQEGTRFTSHSELKTIAPGTDATQAEVIGTGEGTIMGDRLSGTADIQLITSEVPGLDTSFGLAPTATTSQRIKSTWEATVRADGSITVESVNIAAQGETDYNPTKTVLKGKRIADEKSAQ